jgi:hypothetical protein
MVNAGDVLDQLHPLQACASVLTDDDVVMHSRASRTQPDRQALLRLPEQTPGLSRRSRTGCHRQKSWLTRRGTVTPATWRDAGDSLEGAVERCL